MFQLANLVMRFLGSVAFWEGWGYDPADAAVMQKNYPWVPTLYNSIINVLVPIIAVLAAAGTIWAIIIGVQMARADSQDKRDESKKRLISLIVGIAVMVVLIVFFTTLLGPIIKSFLKPAV